PPALDAVCARAMARARSGRYTSATELAEEVQRWLADEPVGAFPEGLSRRLARWARRNRARAQAVVASILAVPGGSAAARVAINAARRSEMEARGRATRLLVSEQQAKKLAEQNADLYRRASELAEKRRNDAEEAGRQAALAAARAEVEARTA